MPTGFNSGDLPSPQPVSPFRIRLFISSPGDLTEERIVCEEVIRELAPDFLAAVTLEPIIWEDLPLTAEAAFQDQIPLPAECDIVVLMLWSRLGSRLHSQYKGEGDAEPPTGTLFEFRNAVEGHSFRGLARRFGVPKERRTTNAQREIRAGGDQSRHRIQTRRAVL